MKRGHSGGGYDGRDYGREGGREYGRGGAAGGGRGRGDYGGRGGGRGDYGGGSRGVRGDFGGGGRGGGRGDYGGGGRGGRGDFGGGGGRGGRSGGGFGGPPAADVPPPSTRLPDVPEQPKAGTYRQLEEAMGLRLKSVRAMRVEDPLPRRPDSGGNLGTPIHVRLNHFQVTLDYTRLNVHHYDTIRVRLNPFQVTLDDARLNVHHYDVSITGSGGGRPGAAGRASGVLPRRVGRQVIAETFREFGASHLGGRLPAFDGVKNLFTAAPLPAEAFEFDVTLPDDRPGPEGAPPRLRNFHVAIKLAARIDMSQLHDFLRGALRDIPQIGIQLLDIVLRERPLELTYMDVGRSFFHPTFGTSSLGGGAEVWKGFYQSVRPSQSALTLNLDLSATAFLEPLPVPQFIMQILSRRDLRQPLNDVERMRVKRALLHRQVEVTHRGNMRRKYKVKDISPRPLQDLSFPLRQEEGEVEVHMTVVRYFQTQYNVRLDLLNMPCIDAGSPGRANYLPIEVCKIVAGQPYKKKLSDIQTSQMLVQAARRPMEREREINDTMRQLNFGQSDVAREFQISISDRMLEVDARILPPPQLQYSGNPNFTPQAGSWNMRNVRVRVGAQVPRWAAVNLSRLPDPVVQEFTRSLAQMCNTTGLRMAPTPVVTLSGHPAQYEQLLRDLVRTLPRGPQGPQVDIVICVLNENNGPLYGYLKRLCETDLGLVTQVCLAKNIGKGPQYNANVALKINAKVGGSNAFLTPASIPRMLDAQLDTQQPTMLFGADVTHPMANDEKPSIAAVVASMDWPGMSQYHACVAAQTSRLEIIRDLYTLNPAVEGPTAHGGMIKDLLISYYQTNRRKPQRIIMYRDGVSEGQFAAVKAREVTAFKRACRSMDETYEPRLTFVIVQKRHHTRFFVPDRRLQDRSGNAPPGTVVDRGICHPNQFDFYLMAHAGIQGTSRPTHYHVVHDENSFDSNSLQMFTYHLSYTFTRCTRSVSVAPPAYYAHLVAFRARFYSDEDASDTRSQGGRGLDPAEGASSSSTRVPEDIVVRPLPAVCGNIQRRMFFT